MFYKCRQCKYLDNMEEFITPKLTLRCPRCFSREIHTANTTLGGHEERDFENPDKCYTCGSFRINGQCKNENCLEFQA